MTKDSMRIKLDARPQVSTTHAELTDKQLEGQLVALYMRSNARDQEIVMEVFNRYKRVQRRLRIAEEFILNLENQYLNRLHKELLINPDGALYPDEE